MNRIEFCAMLTQCRQDNNISKNEMCRLAAWPFKQLQLIEAKPNNFSMDKAFVYLTAIHNKIVLRDSKTTFSIDSIEAVAAWLKQARKERFSLRSLAVETQCSFVTLSNIERMTNKITVDIFLKLVEALDYTLTIEPNE